MLLARCRCCGIQEGRTAQPVCFPSVRDRSQVRQFSLQTSSFHSAALPNATKHDFPLHAPPSRPTTVAGEPAGFASPFGEDGFASNAFGSPSGSEANRQAAEAVTEPLVDVLGLATVHAPDEAEAPIELEEAAIAGGLWAMYVSAQI